MHKVKVQCPECKQFAEIDLNYNPSGRGATFADRDGKKVDEQGFLDCEHCKAQFVYKLEVKVHCNAARLKF
jgi:transposase-like protein